MFLEKFVEYGNLLFIFVEIFLSLELILISLVFNMLNVVLIIRLLEVNYVIFVLIFLIFVLFMLLVNIKKLMLVGLK